MGWITRGKNSYYYGCYRDSNGHVRTKYEGKGSIAVRASERAERRKEKRRDIRRRMEREQADLGELNHSISPLIDQVEQLFRARMALAGFRLYPGRIWRNRRQKMSLVAENKELKTLDDAIRAAERGDPRALNAVRSFLIKNPDLWRASGDLATQAIRQWIHKTTKGDLFSREMVIKKVASLRNDLKRDGEDTFERLILDRVILTWARLNHLEHLDAISEPESVSWGKLRLEQHKRAEKSYRNALSDLLAYQERRTHGVSDAHMTQESQVSSNHSTPSFVPINRIHNFVAQPA